MGTRSLTRVFDDENEIACIYRQFDGYKSAHGQEVANVLAAGRFVNGIPVGQPGRFFNGMGDFAVQLICALKGDEPTNPGGIYLRKAGTSDVGEEYVYEIRGGHNDEWEPLPITVVCIAYGKEEFRGSPAEFKAWCEAEEEEAA